jgi:hypothetical protein
MGAYVDWLASHVQGEQRRSRLFVHQIAVLPPGEALTVLERCERACLKAATARSVPEPHGPAGDPGVLAIRLIDEEQRLVIDARLAWLEYARRQLRALGAGRAARR